MSEPMPTARGQDKKMKEMIENVSKLNKDVKDLREAFDDIILGQKTTNLLLKNIEKKCQTL